MLKKKDFVGIKEVVFFFLALLFSSHIHTQNNKKDSLNVKASLGITGIYQSGNVKTFIFNAKGEVKLWLWEKVHFSTTNSYVYQEFGGVKADEDVLSLNFVNFNEKAKFHPFVLGFFSTNYRRRIDYRYLVGGGITYNLLQKKKQTLKFSISGEYEHTDFNQFNFNNVNYQGAEVINTFRSTLWIKGKYTMFKNKMILSHESYLQPSLEDSDNYRWQANLALELPVWKFLNFKINYLYTFESIVISNQLQEDKFLTMGFTLKNF